LAVQAESKNVDAKIVDPKSVDAKAVDPQGDPKKKKSAAAHLKSVWPMIGELVRPRRGLLALSFLLLLVGRLCGLVLPAAPKYLLDDVIGKHRANLLLPLVLGVLAAT
jgi:ABC-type bacteriocin/lantibiotic exporter with double-glycine peptidase domain